ncbi:hypothetical protein [Gloeobacter morelensis]|uniref:hypothetical protein n=1 Tax=Gloeobacter morelensis TaxID=2907343 RepID=UPI001E48564F|nr:hypothetical protein [Gloeobacter morelensis]UFP97145.1 hypothetical protein ISF26_23780 [Gloeobacter morelensis MG652769]
MDAVVGFLRLIWVVALFAAKAAFAVANGILWLIAVVATANTAGMNAVERTRRKPGW